MFNLKILQSFIPIFNKKSHSLVKELEGNLGKCAFDILPNTNNCTLDGICCEYLMKIVSFKVKYLLIFCFKATVMGLDVDLKSNKGKEFIQSLSA